jgi:hypothetical protein
VDIVHAQQMAWGESLTPQRAGRMAHKRLFEGEEQSPDNYLLVLANEGSDYFSPRHRHAFDQVRLCLEGSIPIARDQRVDAGEVGYFPEGVHYGPQQGGPDRVVLLLQFGGASGLGYLSVEQLRVGRERLLAEGVFERGVFRRQSGPDKKNEDGYEALWRSVTGRTLSYPKARYKAPVVMCPDGFTWHEVAGVPGVRRKMLGLFPERGLSLEFLQIAAGSSYLLERSGARRLIFVLTGRGHCSGVPFFAHSAIRLSPGETAGFAADVAAELFVIDVPLIASLPRSPATEPSSRLPASRPA